MKVLILSGAFGMGHNAVAKAISQQVMADSEDNQVEIVDLLTYIYPKGSQMIYSTFNLVAAKYHGIYNFFNKAFEKDGGKDRYPSQVFKKVEELLMDKKPDRIICTLPLCGRLIAGYKRKTNDPITLATCVTDISTHSEWFTEETDIYLVPTKSVKEKMIDRGVTKAQIIVTGIPVKREFLEKPKTYSQKSGRREVLIMGGGLGLLPDTDALIGLLKDCDNVHVTIITGKNKQAYTQLKIKYPTVEVLGYVNNVSKYMRRADLLISKAGGITIFEAMATGTPLLVIDPFLEQEVQNAKYLEANGLGKVFPKGTEPGQIRDFIRNEVEQERIKRNMMAAHQEISGALGKATELIYVGNQSQERVS